MAMGEAASVAKRLAPPRCCREQSDDYIKDRPNYHVITNNCADFVNDCLNEADDVSVWDDTLPNEEARMPRGSGDIPIIAMPSTLRRRQRETAIRGTA